MTTACSVIATLPSDTSRKTRAIRSSIPSVLLAAGDYAARLKAS
jgi:hypothetical protein